VLPVILPVAPSFNPHSDNAQLPNRSMRRFSTLANPAAYYRANLALTKLLDRRWGWIIRGGNASAPPTCVGLRILLSLFYIGRALATPWVPYWALSCCRFLPFIRHLGFDHVRENRLRPVGLYHSLRFNGIVVRCAGATPIFPFVIRYAAVLPVTISEFAAPYTLCFELRFDN